MPIDLDLGAISSVKPGDQLAVIHTYTGKRVVSSVLATVTEIKTDGFVRCGKCDGFYLKNLGATYYFMQRGLLFFSVNPEHIAEAKETARKVSEETRIKAEALARKTRFSAPIGALLGDGERRDSDGDIWISSDAADVLTEKLTAEQLETLAGWLGV